MSRKDDIKNFEGVRFTPLEAPPWRHGVLKFIARILYSRKAKYVIVIHDFEPNK